MYGKDQLAEHTVIADQKELYINGHPQITTHIKGGGRRNVTSCDKGGILNFVTSHFKNSIKTILQV